MEIIWLILIGLVAGWLAGQITKGSGFGVSARPRRPDAEVPTEWV